MRKITQKEVRDLFEYCPDSGTLKWKVTSNSRAVSGSEAMSINNWGYKRVQIKGRRYLVHIIIWLYVYGYIPEHEIDHINKNSLDNRLCNLREASRQCNARNTKNRSDNTSGVKGVGWVKRDKKWSAKIILNGKVCSLGYYNNFENAVCARLAGEQSLNWSGCDSYSPAFNYVKNNINNDAK